MGTFREKSYFHKCTVCGVTEKDNPDMEFRYCMTCEGHYEYCMEHLKNHEHIKKVEKLSTTLKLECNQRYLLMKKEVTDIYRIFLG